MVISNSIGSQTSIIKGLVQYLVTKALRLSSISSAGAWMALVGRQCTPSCVSILSSPVPRCITNLLGSMLKQHRTERLIYNKPADRAEDHRRHQCDPGRPPPPEPSTFDEKAAN